MALPGTNLTLDELLSALQWKLESGDDAGAGNSIGIESHSHSQPGGNSVVTKVPERQRFIRLLENCLNSLRPINKLPFEILGQIFLFVQSRFSNKSFILPRKQLVLKCANSWIKVTHICQHWRRVAHNTKSLWRRITIDGAYPFPTYLAHLSFTLSPPLSISLEHQFGPSSDSENELQEIENFYTLLLDHPNRVAALYLRLSGDVPKIVRHLTRQTFPNIVELELSFEEPDRKSADNIVHSHYWDRRLLGSNGDLEGILGGQAASLRKLSLTNYTWPSVVFPALTHLYLKDEFYDPEDGDLGQKFLEILASLSSSLQVLCFHGTRSPDPDIYTILPISARPVMRVLRYLEILDAEPSYGSILPLYNLSLPAIETLIWDSQWGSEFDECPPPPNEYFERVTCLAGCGKRKAWPGVFVIMGKTHFFEPGLVTFNSWPIWQTLLPKIETLALDWDPRSPDNLISLLRRFSALRFLHLNMSKKVLLVIAHLEKREGDSNSDFLRRFQRLNIYIEDEDFDSEQQKLSDRLFQKGLPRLDFTADNSMTRTRRHIRRKYTLRFERGHIDQLCYRDIAE